MPKHSIATPEAPQPAGAYSQGVGTGSLVFTAGFGPHDPRTGKPRGADIAAQTVHTLDNIAKVLEAAGTTVSSIVKVTAHLADLERDFAGFDNAFREYLSAPYPARTTVGSTLMGILVEIDVVALIPKPPTGPGGSVL
jgi:reactive intermediate/imine deaminase